MAMDKEREALMRVCQGMIDIVERVGCKDWRDQHGRRLKDTKEWVEFYVTVHRAAEQAALSAQPQQEPVGDTGNPEADSVINRLMSDDPDFDDCTDAAVLIRKLVAEHRGPDGFATWKDAAIAERLKRVSQQQEPVAWIRYCSDGTYEGPIANSAIDDVRKKSGVWTPLYTAPPSGVREGMLRAAEICRKEWQETSSLARSRVAGDLMRAITRAVEQVNAEDDGYASAHPRPFFDPSAPQSEQTHVRVPDSGELWSFCRKLLSQGKDIHLDHETKSYEQYSARLDAAARERGDELEAMLRAATGKESE